MKNITVKTTADLRAEARRHRQDRRFRREVKQVLRELRGGRLPYWAFDK